MATLNFADILTAPEFLDSSPPAYIRTTRTIDQHGRGVDTSFAAIPFVAIFAPDDSTLARLPDGSRLSASITIYSQVYLSDGLKVNDLGGTLADVVLWHGRRYTVKAIQDWDAFASMGGGYIDFGSPVGGSPQGFFVASADLLPLNPTLGV